jgi:hypothetical protein
MTIREAKRIVRKNGYSIKESSYESTPMEELLHDISSKICFMRFSNTGTSHDSSGRRANDYSEANLSKYHIMDAEYNEDDFYHLNLNTSLEKSTYEGKPVYKFYGKIEDEDGNSWPIASETAYIINSLNDKESIKNLIKIGEKNIEKLFKELKEEGYKCF